MEITAGKSLADDDMTAGKMAQYTCQLYFRDKNEKLIPNGLGVFIVIRDVHFLITAAHLTQYWSDKNRLFVRVGNNYIELCGDLKETDLYKHKVVDLCYVKIHQKNLLVLHKHFKFLPFSKIRESIKLVQGAHYCVTGFPISASNNEKSATPIHWNVEPASQKVYRDFDLDTDIYYLLKKKETKNDSSSLEVNGCGLWQVIIDTNKGKPQFGYILIGIITQRWENGSITLVGIKLALVIDMIRKLEKIEVHEMV